MALTSRKAEAQAVPPPRPSPTPQAWTQFLPEQITPAQSVPALDPAPIEDANSAGGECGRDAHRRFVELTVGKTLQLYSLRAGRNANWVYNPAYPPQTAWGWLDSLSEPAPGGPEQYITPGPTFFLRYGQPAIVRIVNDLPQNHVGFGSPEISTHLHNGHTPSESDGFPGDFFSPVMAGPTLTAPGVWRDHFYPMIYAGYDEFGPPGDPREALGTLFYHDHTQDFTAPNVLRGLFGFALLFDEIDSGNENDTNPAALRLPSHPYDYPLSFADKRFDATGRLTFDQLGAEGTLGDVVAVNGKVLPVLRVKRRKYRLRLLNAGPSRFYHFNLINSALVRQTFTYIANDGNLLPAPLNNQVDLPLGVAERADIIVDFSRYATNTELYLENRARQVDTRQPVPNDLTVRQRVLKFIVGSNPPQPDVSRVPTTLRPIRPIDTSNVTATRRWNFERSNGQWSINGQFMNVLTPRAIIPRGSTEIWEFENRDDGWVHPIHVHFEEGRILSKRVRGVNVAVPAREQGRKDVFVLPPGPDTLVRVLIRFRDFNGKYVMHCHNLIHEDHAMMLRFDIVEPPTP